MAKTQVNFRASAHTTDQLAELIKKTRMNQTEVIAVAIDRMHQEEINMKTSRTKIEPVDVYLDGEYIGTANEIITNHTGEYYAEDGEYLQDNGEYIPVNGYGVETK